MKIKKSRQLTFSLLMVAALLAYFAYRESVAERGKSSGLLAATTKLEKGMSEDDAWSPVDPALKEDGKAELLAELKLEWEKLAPRRTYSVTSAHHALAKKTALALGCSRQTLELLQYFDDENYVFILGKLVQHEVATCFKGASAEEAREDLISLASPSGGSLPPSIQDYIDHWARTAGHHCSADEFQSFFDRLTASRLAPSSAQEALFGYNIQLAATSPSKALRSTIEVLSNKLVSGQSYTSLSELVENFPDDADYTNLVTLLPSFDGSLAPPVRNGYHEFFRRWAESDALAAAHHVIDESMPGNLLGTVAEVVLTQEPSVGVAWVQSFPEGSYFDAAAKVAMYVIGGDYPEEARELASMISDPEVREKSLQIVTGIQSRKGMRH